MDELEEQATLLLDLVMMFAHTIPKPSGATRPKLPSQFQDTLQELKTIAKALESADALGLSSTAKPEDEPVQTERYPLSQWKFGTAEPDQEKQHVLKAPVDLYVSLYNFLSEHYQCVTTHDRRRRENKGADSEEIAQRDTFSLKYFHDKFLEGQTHSNKACLRNAYGVKNILSFHWIFQAIDHAIHLHNSKWRFALRRCF